ncbi:MULTISPECIES: hypothetical protein [Nitratiruptor]|uniref:Septum formation initiator n=1 Tax=Nitratiruptor tergarcus DSM 16512 TaxID=1069081 RepID=A0A1W1WQD1_9BACT|nr:MULTISPECIES: hypothetical protein [Nitratiruptor]BCD62987.1 hypothetical protein NitYY0813_C1873 [Nitratiruptor sp. YY08-13]BCD66922.1 hypothetical protein NitYY0826_C1875 [Nitratiruptor sp. YY08-26]SMC08508.1 hypothetical protein SAMN05660197_0260 [Nitratiruptor tergarcus DSM 16512]
MDKRPQELADSLKKRSWLAEAFRYSMMALVVILMAIYIGALLFGTNSVEVLYQLNVVEKNLKRSINFLKKENARLQKEYFELKELEPKE